MNTDQSVVKIYCPTCGARGDVHKIIYGFPREDFDSETFEMGGCVVMFGDQPNWKCRTCGWEGVNKPRRKSPSIRTKAEGLGKFYAARADSALKRDREAGYHWGYLRGEGKTICTCGLVFDSNYKADIHEVAKPEYDLGVEPLAYARGHRNLPSCKGSTTALIVEHWYSNGGWAQSQEATAYCQACGLVAQNVDLTEAQAFVSEHNESCGK